MLPLLSSRFQKYIFSSETLVQKNLLTRSLYWAAAHSGNTFFRPPDSFYSCARSWGHIDLSMLVLCRRGIIDVRRLHKYFVTTPSCHLNKVEFVSAFWIMKLAGAVLFEPCWRSQLALSQMGMIDETNSRRTEMAFLIFLLFFWMRKRDVLQLCGNRVQITIITPFYTNHWILWLGFR